MKKFIDDFENEFYPDQEEIKRSIGRAAMASMSIHFEHEVAVSDLIIDQQGNIVRDTLPTDIVHLGIAEIVSEKAAQL